MSDTTATAPFANPKAECDLIMKGGITSGVVFPHAIVELAKTYRFCNIGGTSAGAIGAVMAAAAEYRRQTSTDMHEKGAGFERIRVMPAVLAAKLPTFFQPSAETRPLFDIGMAAIRAKNNPVRAVLFQTLRIFGKQALMGAIPGLAILLYALVACNVAAGFLGLLLALIGAVAVIALAFYRAIATTLPANDFGLCSGLTQPGQQQPGFTNWIATEIEAVAGRSGDNPLTIGDLVTAGITIASVTTDLSSRRPYELPFTTAGHSFRKSEFEKLFPEQIMLYLLRVSPKSASIGSGGIDDLYDLPPAAALPVAIIARMSLSFPGLIRAVPLYRRDLSLASDQPGGDVGPVRCLFSDGGITSNFPIHLFDSLLPGKPTFGISLDSYDPRRHATRIHMPNTYEETAEDTDNTPVLPVTSLSGFLGAILSTARNWQDTLQSQLHGYNERIVDIRLDDSKEGGLNLDMDDETVRFLSTLGADAGAVINSHFKFEEHRWRRAVTTLPTLAEALKKFAERYANKELGYAALLTDYQSTGFADLTPERRAALKKFAEKVAAVAEAVNEITTAPVSQQRAGLRITASMETGGPRQATSPPEPPSPSGR